MASIPQNRLKLKKLEVLYQVKTNLREISILFKMKLKKLNNMKCNQKMNQIKLKIFLM